MEAQIVALKAKPLPIARDYETPVLPIARGFQNAVGDKETPWFAKAPELANNEQRWKHRRLSLICLCRSFAAAGAGHHFGAPGARILTANAIGSVSSSIYGRRPNEDTRLNSHKPQQFARLAID